MIEFFVSVLAGISAAVAFDFIKWVFALVRAHKENPPDSSNDEEA